MATKVELEQQIVGLNAVIAELRKAVSILSKEEAMEIILPHSGMDTPGGDSPRIPFRPGLGERLCEILKPALIKHGAKISCETRSSLSLHANHLRTNGGSVIVPVIWGEVLADIIDCAAEFGRECFEEGYSKGSDLLGRLSRGEITADQFEGSIEQKKATSRQSTIREKVCNYNRDAS